MATFRTSRICFLVLWLQLQASPGMTLSQTYNYSSTAPRTSSSPTTSTPVCGGNFNMSFGTIRLTPSEYSAPECSWKIGNAGINNAVAIVTFQLQRFGRFDRVHYVFCIGKTCYRTRRQFLKVYSGRRLEVVLPYKSGIYFPVVLEVPFEPSNVITLQARRNPYPYWGYDDIDMKHLVVQYAILKTSLHSALLPPTPWRIIGYNTSRTSFMVDWSNVPGGLQADFYVLSMNQTRPYIYSYYSYYEASLYKATVMPILNSTHTSLNVSGLPVFSQYEICVYLVDSKGQIYKSEKIVVETDEGVPNREPSAENWYINVQEHSVHFKLDSTLDRRYTPGVFLGYKIVYFPVKEPQNNKTKVINAMTTQVTLTKLKGGTTYVIRIAGFTSKGTGPYRKYPTTLCGGFLTAVESSFLSANFSNSKIPYDYHEAAKRCFWNINPPSSGSTIWLTFLDFSLGFRFDLSCGGGVRLFTPASEINSKPGYLEICGKFKSKTLLIDGNHVNVTGDGFTSYQCGESPCGIRAHYRSDPRNLTATTGDFLKSWTGIQVNVSNTSISLSWTAPPSFFLGRSSVQKYLILNTTSSAGIYQAQWLLADETNLTLSGLKPFTNYSLIVVAIASDQSRRGNTGWIHVQTDEGVATRNPSLSYYNSFSGHYHKTLIKWRRLEQRYVPGILRGYRVYYQKESQQYPNKNPLRNITVGPDTLEVNITGLQAGTKYYVWIKAFTSKGEGGQVFSGSILTRCGAVITNSSGVIQTPGFPNRTQVSDCEWIINPGSQIRTVLVTFKHFYLSSCRYSNDDRFVYDGSGANPDTLCAAKAPFDIVARSLRITYRSHSSSSGNSLTGFQAEYVVFNGSITEVPVLENWNINNFTINVTSIDVHWTKLTPNNEYSVRLYAVVCTPLKYKAGPRVAACNQTETSLQVPRLRGLTEYTVQVVALVMLINGSLSLKGSRKLNITTKAGVPSEPPVNVNVLSADANTITVSWSPIDDYNVNGILQGYMVFYRSEIDFGDYSKIQVGQSTQQATIRGSFNPHVLYEITVAGITQVGVGVKSFPQFVRPGCKGVLYEKVGVIKSPGFPKQYPSETKCEWLIKPHPAIDRYRVAIIFDSFHTRNLEGRPNCTDFQYDFIRFGNVDIRETRANVYCGIKRPFTLINEATPSHPVTLTFVTSQRLKEHAQGFNSTYLAVSSTPRITVAVSSGSIKRHEVGLTFTPSFDVKDVQEYIVLFKPLKMLKVWNFKRTKQTQFTLRSLNALTEYSVMVLGYTASNETYGSQVLNFVTMEATEPSVSTTASLAPITKGPINHSTTSPLPPPVPRTPSEEERSQSVKLEIRGLNASQWSKLLEDAFKTAVANAATKHCSKQENCQGAPASARRKRTTDRVTFTKKQVHILPGYPKQISQDPLLASLAFYLQSSAGSSNAVIKRETLVSIVKGSVASISNAVNGTISSVQTLLAVQPTIPTTKSTTATKTSQNGGIIAGCIFGSILLIVIAGVIVWRYRYPNTSCLKCLSRDGSGEAFAAKMEMGTVGGSTNEAYGKEWQVTFERKADT